jgi:FkbM family methyltransferase
MVLNQAVLGAAARLYRATPSQRVRQLYFNAFLRFVRGRRIVRDVEGMTFELDLGEMIDVSVLLQQYERDIVALIERLTTPGCTVLDIGANVGAHALRFSKLTGPAGYVYAFEPTDYAYRKLQRNLELNRFPQTRALQLALGEQAALQQPVTFRSSWRSDLTRDTAVTHVDFVALDDWCRAEGVERIDVVKLDVDGHEYPVLAGGQDAIRRSRPAILIEAGAWHFRDAGRSPFVLLQDAGYRFWDTKTLVEYPTLRALAARLPEDDAAMDFSVNVLARMAPLDGPP